MTRVTTPLHACLRLACAISRTSTVDQIYEAALDALEEGLEVTRASILLFDPDGVMRFKAWRQLSSAYRAAVEGHTPWTPESVDPEPLVVDDVSAEPTLAAFLPTIAAEGIRAMLFVPLVSSGRVIGKFMVYHHRPWTPSSDELELASLIASQVAFAVERTRARSLAAHNSSRLQFALDAADMGTWDWDLESNVVQWSEGLERLHGHAPGTFDGSFDTVAREMHPDDRDRVMAAIQQALADGRPYDTRYRIVLSDGSLRWVEGKGRVEYGPDGRPARLSGVCLNVTARAEAELARIDALELSTRASRQLAAVVESSGDAIVSKDLNGVITSWNPAAERLFGYSAAEAVGRSITLIIPEDRLPEEDDVLQHIRAGEPLEMETVRRRKDGSSIDISLVVSPIRTAEGVVIGASKVARDITVRKREEAERAELHRRLTMLVSASASLLDALDRTEVITEVLTLGGELMLSDGRAIWVSDGDRQTWRVAGSVNLSDTFAARVIGNYTGPAPGSELFARALAIPDVTALPVLADQQQAYRDEGIRSMLVCPMRLGDERFATLVFYYRNPREFSETDAEAGETLANLAAACINRAELHEELRRQRNEAEAARRQTAFLADATAILSGSLEYEHTLSEVATRAVPEIADWCVIDLLDGAGELQLLTVTHVDPNKVELARSLRRRYGSDPEAAGNAQDVVRTGRPVLHSVIAPEEVAAHARDADHRALLSALSLSSYMCVPILAPRGPRGTITFVQAESGRHYDSRDLVLAQELAARAALSIENAIAYRRANEASRVKDEFLATLSHELRTPLNAVLGYAQMVEQGVLGDERRQQAMKILVRNGKALKQLIDDVLDVSRIETGQLRLSARRVQLRDMVNAAVATIQPAADARAVRVEVSAPASVAPVWGDPDRLQQIAWNLLSNAVKFTPRGGAVDVRVEQRDGWVCLVVADNGQGIAPEFLPHIFERFSQADCRSSHEHGGLGLGLAIVRELTELHGGVVSAASEGADKGAIFTVFLPPLREEADRALEPPPDEDDDVAPHAAS